MLKFLYLSAKDFVYLFLRLILWCFVIFGLAMITKFFWSDSFGIYFDTVNIYKLNIIRFSALGICGVVSCFILFLSILKPAQWFALNMFSNEGALTHTLPVPGFYHIAAKALSALLMNIIVLLSIIISVFAFKEGITYFEDILISVNEVMSGENPNLSISSFVIPGLISLVSLCFIITAGCYLSMSLGQLVSGFRNMFIFICWCGICVLSLGIFVFVALNGHILDISTIDGMEALVNFVGGIFNTISLTNFILGVIYNVLSGVIVTYKLNI